MRVKLSKIVCAVDASEHSEAILAVALDQAARHGAELVLVSVLESIQSFMHARMEEYLRNSQYEQLQQAGRERLEQALRAQVAAACAGDTELAAVSLRVVFVEGRPSSAILGVADDEQAGLLVVGSHGHGTLGGLLLGSTAHELCQRTPLPLLLVPAQH